MVGGAAGGEWGVRGAKLVSGVHIVHVHVHVHVHVRVRVRVHEYAYVPHLAHAPL